MIRIDVLGSSEIISCQVGVRTTTTQYRIVSTGETESLTLSENSESLPKIPVVVPVRRAASPEVRVAFPLSRSPFFRLQEEPVSFPDQDVVELPCDVLPLDVVAHFLEASSTGYPFELIVSEAVSNEEIAEVVSRVARDGAQPGEREVEVRNLARNTELGYVPVEGYVEGLGDLRETILRRLQVEGLPSHQWHIEIDDIPRPFSAAEYDELVSAALSQSVPGVLSRIPTWIDRQFPTAAGRALPVRVVLDRLPASATQRIRYRAGYPEQEPFVRTGIEEIDQLLVDVHRQLLDAGVPVSPDNCGYEAVLGTLLKHRRSILRVPRYVNPDVLRSSERAFHDDLHGKLAVNLEFGDPVYSELDTGNARADLLINGWPTELKIERRVRVTTREIFDSYKAQAADYVGRFDMPIGFLVVLDAVPQRDAPVPPAVHDVEVLRITNSAGGITTVIGVVVRLPRSSSEFSA